MKTKQSPLQILQALRELLSESFSWTRETLARNKDGKSTHPLSDDACSWDLVGGLQKISGGSILDRDETILARDFLLAAIYPPSVILNRSLVHWQDERTRRHEEILRVIDQAIDHCKKSGKPNLPTPNRHRYRSSGPGNDRPNTSQQNFHRAKNVEEVEHD